jgi:hypothetical protein
MSMGAGPQPAGSMFPAGTMVSRCVVPGGIDLVYWGPDLAAIQKVLEPRKCGSVADPTAETRCSVTSDGKCVDLAARGPGAAACCAGLTGGPQGK